MDKRRTYLGIILAILVALCYAATPTITRIAYLNGVEMGTIIFNRYLWGAVFYLVIILIMKKPFRLSREQYAVLGTLGVLSAVSATCINVAYSYLSSGLASLLALFYMVPVVIAEILLGRERITINKTVCLFLAFVGMSIIFITPTDISQISRLGVCLGVIHSLLTANSVLFVNSKLLKSVDPLVIIFYMAIPVSFIALLFNQTQGIPLLPAGTEQWLPVIAVTVLNAFIGQIAFYIAIRLIGGGNVGLINTVEALFSTILGVMVLKDSLTLPFVAGGTLILLSLFLLGINLKKRSGGEQNV